MNNKDAAASCRAASWAACCVVGRTSAAVASAHLASCPDVAAPAVTVLKDEV